MLERFVAQEPRLRTYRVYLDDIQRRRAHTLTRRRGDACSPARPSLASGPSTIYGILSDADFPYPTVTLSDGKTVKLDSAAFSVYRGVPNRDDRQKVMAAFFSALGHVPRHVRRDAERADAERRVLRAGAQVRVGARRRALDGPNIPTSVYTRLIDGVNRHLPTFHRYLQLRQKHDGACRSCTTTTSTRRWSRRST